MEGRIHKYTSACPHSLSPASSSMINGLNNKKPSLRRKGSNELDVFEATWYFSVGIDAVGPIDGRFRSDKAMAEETAKNSMIPPASHPRRAQKAIKDNNKGCKPPSSSCARLASFLNSFFNHTASKRRKTSWKVAGERKSSSSSSKPQSSRSIDSRSIYSCVSSDFESQTPTMVVPKELRNYKVIDFTWLAGKANQIDDGYVGRSGGELHGSTRFVLNKAGDGLLRGRDPVNGFTFKWRKSFRGREEVDGGSDCSSDLFDLNIIDLCSSSNGLPVYRSPDMEAFRRGARIASL